MFVSVLEAIQLNKQQVATWIWRFLFAPKFSFNALKHLITLLCVNNCEGRSWVIGGGAWPHTLDF